MWNYTIGFGGRLAPVVKAEIANFDSSPVVDREARAAINRENALRLFPRFAETTTPALTR